MGNNVGIGCEVDEILYNLKTLNISFNLLNYQNPI